MDRLLDIEQLLRRAVPVLVIFFLAVTALARWIELGNQANEARDAASRQIAVVAELIAERAGRLISTSQGETDRQAMMNVLSDTMDRDEQDDGRVFYVTDVAGRILAALPARPGEVGRPLAEVLGPVVTAGPPGRDRSVLEMNSADGTEVLVARAALDAAQLAVPLGVVAVVQPTEPLLRAWRRALSVNATMFVLTSIIVLVLLLAYYAQVERALALRGDTLQLQNRFDTALSRGRAGLWDWDLARGRIFWSASMHEMLGLPAREAQLGFADLVALVHPDDLNMYNLANAVFDERHQLVDEHFRLRHTQGSYVWVRFKAQTVLDQFGEKRLIGICTDITDQEALRQQSRRNDLRLREAIENLSESFVLWDPDGRLVLCNSRYLDHFNLKPEQVRPGARREDVEVAAARAYRHKKSVTPESGPSARAYEIELSDARWLQVSEHPTRDGGEVAVGTDVTFLKRAQRHAQINRKILEEQIAESEQSRARLDKEIAKGKRDQAILESNSLQLKEVSERYGAEKRRAEQERQRAEEERQRAEEANRAKSDFLAAMSHELRTPLNAIIGFSDMMIQHTFGPLGSSRYDGYARDIRNSGGHLLELINDVLDMARIDAGRLELQPVELELGALVEEAMHVVSHLHAAAGFTFEHDVTPGLVVRADRRAVLQVLLNLLSNAVKFSGDSRRILVRAASLDRSVFVAIQDFGIGIAPVQKARLGQPFVQVGDQMTSRQGGSGLGLAISRSLIDLHGGRVRIHSAPGRGTLVAFTLPVDGPKASERAA